MHLSDSEERVKMFGNLHIYLEAFFLPIPKQFFRILVFVLLPGTVLENGKRSALQLLSEKENIINTQTNNVNLVYFIIGLIHLSFLSILENILLISATLNIFFLFTYNK